MAALMPTGSFSSRGLGCTHPLETLSHDQLFFQGWQNQLSQTGKPEVQHKDIPQGAECGVQQRPLLPQSDSGRRGIQPRALFTLGLISLLLFQVQDQHQGRPAQFPPALCTAQGSRGPWEGNTQMYTCSHLHTCFCNTRTHTHHVPGAVLSTSGYSLTDTKVGDVLCFRQGSQG